MHRHHGFPAVWMLALAALALSLPACTEAAAPLAPADEAAPRAQRLPVTDAELSASTQGGAGPRVW